MLQGSRQGRVVSAQDGYAVVLVQRLSVCQSCAAKSGCGVSLLSQLLGRRHNTITVHNSLDLTCGDAVILSFDDDTLLKLASLVYAVPLLVMVFAAAMVSWGIANEALTVAAGVSGLYIGFVVVSKRVRTGDMTKQMRVQRVTQLSEPRSGSSTRERTNSV